MNRENFMKEGNGMKLTIECSTTELQKTLQAIAGSQEHKEGFQPSGSESIIMPLSSEHMKKMWDVLSTAAELIQKSAREYSLAHQADLIASDKNPFDSMTKDERQRFFKNQLG